MLAADLSTISICNPFLFKSWDVTIDVLMNIDNQSLTKSIRQVMKIQESETNQIRLYRLKRNPLTREDKSLTFISKYDDIKDGDRLLIVNFFILGQSNNIFSPDHPDFTEANGTQGKVEVLSQWRKSVNLYCDLYTLIEQLKPQDEYANLVENCLNNVYIYDNLTKYLRNNADKFNLQRKSSTLPDLNGKDLDAAINDSTKLPAMFDILQIVSDSITYALCDKLKLAIDAYRTDLAHLVSPKKPRVVCITQTIGISISADILETIKKGQTTKSVKEIGHGGFGTAYRYAPKNLPKVVIKIVKSKLLENTTFTNQQHRQSFYREIENTRELRHKNIIEYYEGLFYKGHAFIIMEYGGISLSDKYFNKSAMTDEAIEDAVYAVACGLNYLHNEQTGIIIHRDIRTSNIVVSNRENQQVYKIIDFGISKETSSMNSAFRTTDWGNMLWKSPEYCYLTLKDRCFELLENVPVPPLPGRTVDIWSTAVAILEMKHFPIWPDFFSMHHSVYPQRLLGITTVTSFSPLEAVDPDWSDTLTTVLNACLQYNPGDRWDAQELENYMLENKHT